MIIIIFERIAGLKLNHTTNNGMVQRKQCGVTFLENMVYRCRFKLKPAI